MQAALLGQVAHLEVDGLGSALDSGGCEHNSWLGVQNAAGQGLCRESSKHHRVDCTDACACQLHQENHATHTQIHAQLFSVCSMVPAVCSLVSRAALLFQGIDTQRGSRAELTMAAGSSGIMGM